MELSEFGEHEEGKAIFLSLLAVSFGLLFLLGCLILSVIILLKSIMI